MTSSPRCTPGMSVTSSMQASMQTVPTIGAYCPRTSIRPRFVSARGRPSP